MLVGDYNQIILEIKKIGGKNGWRNTIGSLWKLIKDYDFVGLGFLGTKLTLTNSRWGEDNIIEKIDCAFCNQA